MTDKAPPAGWVVQVTVPPPPASPTAKGMRWFGVAVPDPPSFQYFNVAIAAPNEAMEATTKQLASAMPEAKEWDTSVVRGLSSRELAALSLNAGEVKPA